MSRKLKIVLAVLVAGLIAFGFVFDYLQAKKILTPTSADSIVLDSESNELLENFLANLRNEDYPDAYELTGVEFHSEVKEEEMKHIAFYSGLEDFVTKKWLTIDRSNPALHAVVRGEFTDKNEQADLIVFTIIEEDGDLKIGSISMDYSLEELGQLFPQGEDLQKRLYQDISALVDTVENKTYDAYYNGLSLEARSAVTVEDIALALGDFEKEDKDLSIEEETVIEVLEDFPKIDPNGKVWVSGEYRNELFLVDFYFGYVFEWGWKLNSIDIDAKKL